MTLDQLLDSIRSTVRNDPQPGMSAGAREKPRRTVTGRFMGYDAGAAGSSGEMQPYVVYTVERRIPLRVWKKWFDRSGAQV